MGWVDLKHSKCELPTLDDCKKDGAETGSIWKCKTVGCSRTYQLLLERGTWVETTPKVDAYVPTQNLVPLEGAEQMVRRTPIAGEIMNRLDLEITARYTSEARTIDRGTAAAILRREGML